MNDIEIKQLIIDTFDAVTGLEQARETKHELYKKYHWLHDSINMAYVARVKEIMRELGV